MERNEVSIHEVKVAAALRTAVDKWLTNKEIAEHTGIPYRTVAAHTLKLVKLGLVDQAEVFPAHRFRWSDKAGKRNVSYNLRLETAAEIFQIAL